MPSLVSALALDPVALVEFILAVVTLGYILRLFLLQVEQADCATNECADMTFEFAPQNPAAPESWSERLRLLSRVGNSVPLAKRSLTRQRVWR